MKKWIALVLSVLLAVGLMTACGEKKAPSSTSSESSIENKSTEAEKTNTERDGILKLASFNRFELSKEGATLVFDTLTGLDHEYRAVPNLITEWKANPNYTEYDLTIRDDIVFHDGTPMTAEIVKWNIEHGGAVHYCSYSYNLAGVDVVDPTHLKVRLSAPYLYLEKDLGLVPCIPTDGYTDEGKYKTFVGTGAFRFVSTDEGEVSTLEKSEMYWNKDFDTDIKKVEWHTIPDEQTRKLALESGKVNAIGLTEHYISMPYTVIHELQGKDQFAIVKENDDDYTSVGSLNTNWKGGVMSNLELRRFLASAIDREDLVKNIFFEIPRACGHVYNPRFEDGPQEEQPFTYSEEEARKHLEAAGYRIGDASTPTVDGEGKPLKIKLICSHEEHEKDFSLYLKEVLSRWGIELDIHSLQGAARYEMLKSGDYDLEVNHPWFVPMIGSLGFIGLGSDYSDYGLGFSINEDMQKAADGYIQATDKESAKKYSDEIWKTQYEQVTSIPLFGDIRYVIHDKVFDGFHFDGNVYRIDLNGVKYQ